MYIKYFEWVKRCKNSNATLHKYILEVRGKQSCFPILVKSISKSCNFVDMFLREGYFIRSPSLSYQGMCVIFINEIWKLQIWGLLQCFL